jgi:hypothetical protein
MNPGRRARLGELLIGIVTARSWRRAGMLGRDRHFSMLWRIVCGSVTERSTRRNAFFGGDWSAFVVS